MPRYMTHVEFADAAIIVRGMTDGLDSWMPLNGEQRTGWACIACATVASQMRPVGHCDEGQVFLCVSCHNEWASDVPEPDEEPHSYPCPTCGGNGCAGCAGTGERLDR